MKREEIHTVNIRFNATQVAEMVTQYLEANHLLEEGDFNFFFTKYGSEDRPQWAMNVQFDLT